jgi:hypothetical protein
VTAPVLLVCADAARDPTCAERGRRLTAALAGPVGDRVWECSHLGGHRFAATGVLLPTGYVYAGLTPHLARAVLAAAERGAVHPAGLRGRSTWSRPGQVAEIHIRRLAGVAGSADVTVPDEAARPGGALVTVRHRDGRRWTVDVRADRLSGGVGPPARAGLGVVATHLLTGPARPAPWRGREEAPPAVI